MKHVKKDITASFIYYNANSRNKFTGDCVKRAISFALGLDYDQVARELNAAKKVNNEQQFNTMRNITKYLKSKGYSQQMMNKSQTLGDFSAEHPEGTFICHTRSSGGHDSHLVAVQDGNIYDSWNSSDQIVQSYWIVDSTPLLDIDISELLDPLNQYLEDVITSLGKKYESFGDLYYMYMFERIDKTTAEAGIRFKITRDLSPIAHRWDVKFVGGYQRERYRNLIDVKINPKKPLEENLQMLLPKVKQRVYDWVYNIVKPIKDAFDSENIEVHPDFSGSKSLLMKLPQWCRNLVTTIRDDGDTNYTDRIQIWMDPLPEDPIQEEVYFRGDTWTEIKWGIDSYKKNFSRVDYDY